MAESEQIMIASANTKIELLRKSNKTFRNNKLYSINEFKKLYYFDYKEEALFYIMTKYNVIYEIAKIYLENMYYINDNNYQNSKLSFLYELKKELISKKLLKINKLFLSTLKNKTIIFYHLPISKEVSLLINDLSKNNTVIVKQDEEGANHHTIYELSTLEDEVVFVANKICALLQNGLTPNKIYLTNLNDEYRKSIKKIFPMFNIPYTLDSKESIYTTFIATKFFENYSSDLSTTLNSLTAYIDSPESEDIYNKIINIINKYTFVEDKNLVKSMIKYDFKNTYIKKIDIPNSIHEVSLKETIFNSDDFVFVLSFNQGSIPIIYKDEDYLNDKDKELLNISLTIDKNNLEKEIISKRLNSLTNTIITYKKLFNGEEFTISSLNEILDYDTEVVDVYNLNYSDLYNQLKLTSLLDEHYKYNTNSALLNDLYHHYSSLPYLTYHHTFTGINPTSLKEYLNNKLTLSYSSLDKYFRCPFSYYIGNILKLNIYEETFFQLVGTLFHSILEKFNTTTLSYDELWTTEVNNLNHEFNNKEKFFLIKLKEELKFIIEVIKEQETFTNLHDELHEERIYTNIEGNIKITFTGIIDKIKYKKTGTETIIAIIDYKTGNPNLDLTTVPYGIGMQLPIYLYLAKNSSKLKNVKVAGFYLQKVLNNEVSVDNTSTYEQLKKKNLLLQGYSNENINILSEFDTSYLDSNIIKSMKVKNDNSFYSYSKVLSSENMEKLKNIAEEKIIEGANKICNAEFNISPKLINSNDYSCNLCKFKDICFHTNDDYEDLKPLTKEEILGGDNNGLD